MKLENNFRLNLEIKAVCELLQNGAHEQYNPELYGVWPVAGIISLRATITMKQ